MSNFCSWHINFREFILSQCCWTGPGLDIAKKNITCLTFKFCNFQNNFRQNPQWSMLSPAHVSDLHHSLESIGWRCTCKSDWGILILLMFLEPEPHPQSLPTSLKFLGTQFRHVQWKWWYSQTCLIIHITRTSLQRGPVSPKYSPKTLHSSSVRVRHGVNFVNSLSGLYPVLVIVMLYATSCYNKWCYNEVLKLFFLVFTGLQDTSLKLWMPVN